MFGMGERSILVTADWMSRGAPAWECAKMRGVCFLSPGVRCAEASKFRLIEDCVKSKKKYGEAFLVQYNEQDPDSRSRHQPAAWRQPISSKPFRICL